MISRTVGVGGYLRFVIDPFVSTGEVSFMKVPKLDTFFGTFLNGLKIEIASLVLIALMYLLEGW